jgi:hypothetical protein
MNLQVQDFFFRFDQANHDFNLTAFEKLYAERFMFAGPKGTHVVEREAFLKFIPRLRTQLSAMGLVEREVKTVESYPLDSKYLLAKVGWKMVVETLTGNKQVEAFATFILSGGEESALSIVFQLDHQDLAELITAQQSA